MWYHRHKRDLPWRATKDPYAIWLSEIILQQTRVDQGIGYYRRFLKKYPTIKKLAKATEDDVLKLWQGLGYYSRARNMHQTSKEVLKKYNGKFPQEKGLLCELKGIGDYTAAAILSFAFNMKFPVVDGNVFRLLSRYFGIETPIGSTKAKKEFSELAETLMENHLPSDFNQAIMEFGSLQCKPMNPDCISCPLNAGCYAYEKNQVRSLPVKKQKQKAKSRYFHYLVINREGKIAVNKRSENDIWKNLYDFPLIEISKKMTSKKIMTTKPWKEFFGKTPATISSASAWHRHLLSHQTIHAVFYKVDLPTKKPMALKDKLKFVSNKEIRKYAVPKLIENYLNTLHKDHRILPIDIYLKVES